MLYSVTEIDRSVVPPGGTQLAGGADGIRAEEGEGEPGGEGDGAAGRDQYSGAEERQVPHLE